jgi:hypothetical protein
MKLAAFLSLLLTWPLASAAPLSIQDVYERLKPLAAKADRPTIFKDKREISVTLPSEKPRGDENQEWIFSSVRAFTGDSVRQISIETENCNVAETQFGKTAMQTRAKDLIKTVSNQIFGRPFELDGERYFKELGPYWQKPVHVNIRETHPGVRAMRITRGMSKCDGRGGFHFRYDFFL